jgi:hypothetical protein
MSQGKDKTLFTLTSAHDPTSTTEAPRILGNANVRFRDLWFRRNYHQAAAARVRYPLSLPIPTRVVANDSTTSTSSSSTLSSENSSAGVSGSSGSNANTGHTSYVPIV